MFSQQLSSIQNSPSILQLQLLQQQQQQQQLLQQQPPYHPQIEMDRQVTIADLLDAIKTQTEYFKTQTEYLKQQNELLQLQVQQTKVVEEQLNAFMRLNLLGFTNVCKVTKSCAETSDMKNALHRNLLRALIGLNGIQCQANGTQPTIQEVQEMYEKYNNIQFPQQ